jgi:excisionase family DNA binding protein
MRRTTLLRPSIDEYMTVAEAAKLLGVTKQAILHRIWTGMLNAHKLHGGHGMYMLLREEVERLKAQRTRGGVNWDQTPEGVTE